jgi:hypothetical protein
MNTLNHMGEEIENRKQQSPVKFVQENRPFYTLYDDAMGPVINNGRVGGG